MTKRLSPQSMTGYGRAMKRTAAGHVTVELRSTNHRYLEIEQRWPNGFTALQGRLAEVLRGHMRRGRIEVLVFIQSSQRDQRQVTFDEALLSRYYEALLELKGRLGLKGSVTLEQLLALPQAVTVTETRPPAEQLWGLIRQTAEEAVRDLTRMRQREGRKLVADLHRQIQDIARHLRAVKARLPEALAQQRRHIRARLLELMSATAGGSASQLSEAVALVQAADVHEELVRLESHVSHLRQTLAGGGLIGKRLDFIAQELTREANTLGAKVNDAQASRHVVDIKAAIERIREQTQNLE